MISYNNSAPKAVNNVGQFGATEGSIGAYKSAAEYAADAKYWALLSQTKYSSVEEILAEVERLYEQGRLIEEDIKQLKDDFTNQSQTLLGLIQSTGEAIDNTNAATELSKEATQEVLTQLDIISNMTVQTTLLPPNSLATGSYDNLTGVFSFGIPEGKPGRDGTDGTISDIGSVPVGIPVVDDYGFYVDKENGGLYRADMSDIANLIPSVRSVSVNGGVEQHGDIAISAVTSFNSRVGDVVPESGDYSVNQILGAAKSGDNSDITSLSGLSTALSISQGGTGAKTAADARNNLGLGSVAVRSVVPIDQGGTGAITAPEARTNLGLGLVATESILPITKGGTGSTSAENARLALVAAKSGDNSDITSMTNKITFTQPISIPNATESTEAVNLGQLKSNQGASLIGTLDGVSVQDFISQYKNRESLVLYVSDFGVSGSGDETEKIREAHVAANITGAKVIYDVKNVTIDAKANIPVTAPVDFNGCTVTPVFTGAPSYDLTPTFSINGNSSENVTAKLSQAGMRKGEMALYGDMASYSRGTFWMDTRDPLCKRSLSDVTPNHYKTTINRITKYGGLQYPLEHDFTASPSPEAYFRPDEDFWLKVEGAHIDTSGMTSGVVFKALRSQVKFSDITIRQDDNVKMTNIRQIFYLGDGVSQIRFNDISAEAMSTYNSTSGTYLLGSNYAAEIILDNVNAVQGWGALGLHKARDLTVTNSTLNRIDGHYHIFDIDVNHTKLHEFGVHIGVGGGYLRVTNCTKYLGTQTDLTGTSANDIDKTRRSVVYMRDDYGSYFDGDITVDNVVYKMARELTFSSASEEWPGILSCVSFNAGVSTTSSTTPDYGYTAPVPWGTTVTVKNITVEVSRDSILDSWLTFVAVNYNGNYILPSVLMPASITVKDIKYSKPPRTAKIAPVILPDLRGTTAAVASANKQAFFNSIINIENIQSGFAKDHQSGTLNTGVQTLMCMYTQTEISNFPTPSVVPEINVRNFYGFSGRFDIPGRLSLTDCFVIALTDSSGGRNADSFIKISGGFVYALPSSSGGPSSQLPRAEWNSVRFINSPVSPDLTYYDSIQGCTFENGNPPIGVSASVAFTGSVGDSANRLQ